MTDVVLAEPGHFADWMALRRLVYSDLDEEFHREELQKILADNAWTCLLAVLPDGAVAGMAELSLRNVVDGCLTTPVGYIEGLVVFPEYRGLGVARTLVRSASEWFRGQGCQEMATDAELDNAAAQQFHRAMGFEETYRIVQFRQKLGR